ncbi:helix-turn-helix domain-containing protein [Streptomyces sp. NPDC001852]|uniref:helix-turn-helix domain-containing protein n=1 Tax=Streptomyces sp. NPDC001852 TaxID=3364619 RepID=UPI0036778093
MELDVVGLSDASQLVYSTLVGLRPSTASEVADACGLSLGTAGRYLSALVKDGLATKAAGRPPRFTAAAPDVAVTELIHERERQLDAARSVVRQLAERHREARRISDPNIAVELITGHEDISAAVSRLTASARRQLRAFDRPPYVERPGSNLENQRRRQHVGVGHRVIYDRAAVAWPGRLRDDILPSVRIGEDARVREKLPLKLVIADDRWAVIPFSLATGGHSVAYLVHRSPMLAALEAPWAYADLPRVLRPDTTPRSFVVRTPADLAEALSAPNDTLVFIEAVMDPHDAPAPVMTSSNIGADLDYGPRGPQHRDNVQLRP